MKVANEVQVFRAPARHSLDDFARLARGPLEAARVERAIVFGAYARGTADGYSDLDLVVVLETNEPFLERWKTLRALLDALPLPVDLLVYTPDEYRRGLAQGTGIFVAIAEEGVTVYARP